MKKLLLPLFLSVAILPTFAEESAEPRSMRLFDQVVFYDGYNGTVFDANLDDGILRHRNSLYAIRLTDEQLDFFGPTTEMNVRIGALCDNYDRIGNINLALVPKGRESYTIDDEDVHRSELGRFITPFMNKNKYPTSVPYSYVLDNIGYIMHDMDLRAQYDYWIEFELFGVPYAANQQVEGCADRNDVFSGTLDFVCPEVPMEGNTIDVFVPIYMKNPEYDGRYNLNNYTATATDELGKTERTFTFDLPEDVADGLICLITSNHGANSGGEEYNRRWHYVYIDDELVLTYKPGRKSCEPFRKYNTQANGIYGWTSKSDQAWQSFSNWCPGDVIDNRIIRLGAFEAGTHKIKISVPDAVFQDAQGDIPVSIYFQGLTEGTLPDMSAINEIEYLKDVTFKMENGNITFACEEPIIGVELLDIEGRLLDAQWKRGITTYDASDRTPGLYLLRLYTEDGYTITRKFRR